MTGSSPPAPCPPSPWIDQLTPSGTIVADLRSDLASSIAVLHRTHPEAVTGRFSTIPGHFMWLRADVANPLRGFEMVIGEAHR